MKQLLFLILACAFSWQTSAAQTTLDKEEIRSLKSDFKQVAIVAHVNVETAEINDNFGGYTNYRLRAKVIEAFKGKLENNSQIEYFAVTESGYDAKNLLGEKIIFLIRHKDKNEQSIKLYELENSHRSPQDRYLQVFRKLTKSQSSKKLNSQSVVLFQ